MKKIKYRATIMLELTRTVTDEQFYELDLEEVRKNGDTIIKECIECRTDSHTEVNMDIDSGIMEI